MTKSISPCKNQIHRRIGPVHLGVGGGGGGHLHLCGSAGGGGGGHSCTFFCPRATKCHMYFILYLFQYSGRGPLAPTSNIGQNSGGKGKKILPEYCTNFARIWYIINSFFWGGAQCPLPRLIHLWPHSCIHVRRTYRGNGLEDAPRDFQSAIIRSKTDHFSGSNGKKQTRNHSSHPGRSCSRIHLYVHVVFQLTLIYNDNYNDIYRQITQYKTLWQSHWNYDIYRRWYEDGFLWESWESEYGNGIHGNDGMIETCKLKHWAIAKLFGIISLTFQNCQWSGVTIDIFH